MQKGVWGNWKRETARDTLALGSLAFYILVIARALIAPYMNFVYQLVISITTLFILTIFVKDYEKHLARGLILTVLISAFYNVKTFTIFAVIIFIALIASSVYLKTKKSAIVKGIILGIVSTIAGYYSANLLANLLSLPA